MMHPQLHQAIRNISSQTLTCTIHVPKFINSRLQLEHYLRRVNSFNKKKCLRSLSAMQWQQEPDCQQLWSAMRSLAALKYWLRPSFIWFQKPRGLTSLAIEKREQTDSNYEKMLSVTSPTSYEHASRPFLPASEHPGYSADCAESHNSPGWKRPW